MEQAVLAPLANEPFLVLNHTSASKDVLSFRISPPTDVRRKEPGKQQK